jgi:Ala-tRNA(Pro) deacylase
MEMLTRCLNALRRNGIRHSHSIHAAAFTALDVASAERVPAHELVKTVVYRSDAGYGFLLLPADCVVDFAGVSKLPGLAGARLATEDELAQLFPDCEVGAMPPFGNLFHMPVLMDESLAGTEFIAFTAGTHRDVIRMSTLDFRHFVKPLAADFALKEFA